MTIKVNMEINGVLNEQTVKFNYTSGSTYLSSYMRCEENSNGLF